MNFNSPKYFPAYLLMLMLTSCESENFNVLTQNLPAATNDQIGTLEITERSLLGIRGNDPVGATLTVHEQEAFTIVKDTKQNLAGVFNRYGVEEEDHGHDWNFLLKVLPDFNDLYNIVAGHGDKEKWPGCINAGDPCDAKFYTSENCIWSEIDPDHNFYEQNDWFKITSDHCEEGEYLHKQDTLGVYGPFVTDDNHGDNPEIHPAQQFWFRNKVKSKPGDNFYWLAFIQDASQRFQAWVASPIYG